MKYGAKRFNKGKAPLSYMLDMPMAIKGAAFVLQYGEEKYEDRDNYKEGLDPDEIIDSLMRHLSDWKNGETFDPESGRDHLFHALVNAMFLANQEGQLVAGTGGKEQGRGLEEDEETGPGPILRDREVDVDSIIESARSRHVDDGGKVINRPGAPEGTAALTRGLKGHDPDA